MAAGDLTTAAKVKAWIGKADAGADTVLADLVTEASSAIAKYCGRAFISQAFSEIRDGSGGTELFLRNNPASAISSLTVDAVPILAQPADGQPGYFLVNSELLCLSGYRFTRGRKNVRVSGTGGYSAIPADVAQACIELVAAAYQRGGRGGPELQVKSLAVGGEALTFRIEDLPTSIKGRLQRHRQVVPV